MNVTMKQLLEAGVHFGHQTRRWNPKMQQYIFGERNGIHIINLEKTVACLEKALEFIKSVTAQGKKVLLVGTKKQAQLSVEEAAKRSNMPFVNQRWLGGMLTNYETVRKSVHRLETIEQLGETGDYQFYTKKEIQGLMKEKVKLEKNLAGIRHMSELPGAVFIVDTKKEEIATREARILKIPVIALLDTNCDPTLADYVIPGNDDAIRAIKLMTDLVAEAALEGASIFEKSKPAAKEKKDQPRPSAKKVVSKIAAVIEEVEDAKYGKTAVELPAVETPETPNAEEEK